MAKKPFRSKVATIKYDFCILCSAEIRIPVELTSGEHYCEPCITKLQDNPRLLHETARLMALCLTGVDWQVSPQSVKTLRVISRLIERAAAANGTCNAIEPPAPWE